MPTRCSETALLCAVLLVALSGVATAGETPCGNGLPCSAEGFVTALLRVIDVPQPDALLERYDQVFGVELARHTRVLVSALLEVQAPNDVVRFLRLGDEAYPLSLGAATPCVGLAPLQRALAADGWSGGRELSGDTRSELWLYRKGRTQLTARPLAGKADCAATILVTYRRPK